MHLSVTLGYEQEFEIFPIKRDAFTKRRRRKIMFNGGFWSTQAPGPPHDPVAKGLTCLSDEITETQ